ncbi:MAG: molybdenum cofactor biosynthesis protein MoaE [Desulfobacterales bacterium]|jgi:molybdopterin synthase catalytic subunit
MDTQHLIETVKKHPEFDRVGMILCHNGIVRATSRDGRRVKGLEVSVDHDRLNRIIAEGRRRPGIVAVEVSIDENRYLAVGEDVMVMAVAGDMRENVLSALQSMLDAIKKTATRKIEYFE